MRRNKGFIALQLCVGAELPGEIRRGCRGFVVPHGCLTLPDSGGSMSVILLDSSESSGSNCSLYCALIQLSDPVSLTATSEKKIRNGFPSAVPRCSVEISRGPAFL